MGENKLFQTSLSNDTLGVLHVWFYYNSNIIAKFVRIGFFVLYTKSIPVEAHQRHLGRFKVCDNLAFIYDHNFKCFCEMNFSSRIRHPMLTWEIFWSLYESQLVVSFLSFHFSDHLDVRGEVCFFFLTSFVLNTFEKSLPVLYGHWTNLRVLSFWIRNSDAQWKTAQ